MSTTTLPYSGIRILELGSELGEAFCGKLFADYGADVIKLEAPGRRGTRALPPFFDSASGSVSGMHLLLDAGKRSIVADLACESGRAVVGRLAATADAVIDAGAANGPGHDWKALSGKDDLTVARVTPFGVGGPWSGWQGSDLIYQAVTATMYGWGREDAAPLRTPGKAAEFLTGASAAMLLAAVLRQPSGEHRGQAIDVSHASTQLLVAVLDVIRCSYIGAIPHRVSVPFPGIMACADGYVGINLLTDDNWRDFCRMMGKEPLIADPRFSSPGRRLQHTEDLKTIFFPLVAQWKKKDLFDIGSTQFAVPISMVIEPGELPEAEHYAARGSFLQTQIAPGRTIAMPGEYIRMEGCPVSPGGPAPWHGQHTREILRELGYDAAAMAELAREEAVQCS